MLTRQEMWIKWTLYTLAVLLLTLAFALTLRGARPLGVCFYLPPLFVGVVASLEGARAGAIFALCYGAVCDLALPGTLPCVHTLAFVLAAMACAAVAQSLFQPGAICSAVCTLIVFAVFDAFNMLALAIADRAPFVTMLSITLRETAVSLPLLVAVHPVLIRLHRRFVF